MAKEIKLPKFGDTMEEATIVACLVGIGDHVKSGDVLFEIETDKATLEIESHADGYVKHIMVNVGQSYRIGTPLLILGEKDEQVNDDFVRSLTKALATATPAPASSTTSGRQKPAQTAVPSSTAVSLEGLKLGQQIPVTRFHKLTSQKMLRSKQEIPCFYLNVKADVTDLVDYRAKLNQTGSTKLAAGGTVKIAYHDLIIKAVAMGLERFPIMTGQLEGDNIKLAGSISVGLAVAVPEGLVAPIVKDADKKTIVEIARYSQSLADKARDNQLTPENLEGGCITVSNLGALGIDSFIPIVIPGQCSILGIGRIKDVCVPDVGSTLRPGSGQASSPQNGNIPVRKIMNMTLSVDHKVANGAYAAQFLDFVKKTLEEPANFR
jgi:pyruvate dehydrogenase E2 component (dihydrolipoamide acetyltransferase)